MTEYGRQVIVDRDALVDLLASLRTTYDAGHLEDRAMAAYRILWDDLNLRIETTPDSEHPNPEGEDGD